MRLNIKKISKQIKKKVKPCIFSYRYYGNLRNGQNAILLRQDFCDVVRLKEQARAQGLKLIDDYIDAKKKSDTIFIFGSGESVNYLTAEQWEEIKKHNTMAFNDFYVHNFVPDYFVTESIRHQDRHSFFTSIAKEKYASVDMFISYKHALEGNYDLWSYPYPNRMYLHFALTIPAFSNENLKRSLIYLDKRKEISLHTNIINHISQTNSAVSLCYSLGYKNIVLIGIDLNGTPYFTSPEAFGYKSNESYTKLNIFREEFSKKEKEQANVSSIINHQSSINIMLPEIVKTWGAYLMLDEFLMIFNAEILKPKRINLYVSSEKSKLAEFLPVYFK